MLTQVLQLDRSFMIYKMSRFGCHNDVGDEDGDDGIVGQDPDQLRGGFDGEQAFRGDLTQLNIWDYLLPNSIIGQLGRLAMVRSFINQQYLTSCHNSKILKAFKQV